MPTESTRIWLVQAISASRFAAALLFASIAFQSIPVAFISGVYLFAVITDVIDGHAARRLDAQTYFGRVVDLISDKSLTVVSLLYAAASGIPLFPLALIATRDIASLGFRLVMVEGSQLLPTSRLFGGVMAALIWGNTLLLISSRPVDKFFSLVVIIYWLCAVLISLNLMIRIARSWDRIKTSLESRR
jgi:phosphatidylglycerophosphate synthase